MTTRFTPVLLEHRGKPVQRLDHERLSPRERVAAFDAAGRCHGVLSAGERPGRARPGGRSRRAA